MFQKGQSGNPGGSSKLVREMRSMAQEAGPECIEFLLTCMRDTTASRRDRLTANSMLLDRGFGKPTQPVEGDLAMSGKLQVTWLPVASADTGKSE